MLRISLIVAIVMALATLAVSQLKVDAYIKKTQDELATTKGSLETTTTQLAKSKASEKTAVAAAAEAKKELEDTKTSLEEASAKAGVQEKRANDLETKLEDTTRTKNDVQTQLAEWIATGATPQKVRDTLEQNKKLVADMDSVGKENRLLERETARLRNDLQKYQGEKVKVVLPSGLKGKVLAVDPKYQFVVLSIGEEDGVLERGEMLVSRSGKLVAKVRILSVQPKRCVANVMADWQQLDVMEGDQVLVGSL